MKSLFIVVFQRRFRDSSGEYTTKDHISSFGLTFFNQEQIQEKIEKERKALGAGCWIVQQVTFQIVP